MEEQVESDITPAINVVNEIAKKFSIIFLVTTNVERGIPLTPNYGSNTKSIKEYYLHAKHQSYCKSSSLLSNEPTMKKWKT